MTLATLDALSTAPNQCRIQAWAGSTILHVAAVLFAVFFLTEIPAPSQTEPLRLDIAMIQPPPPVEQKPESKPIPQPTPVPKKVVPEKITPPTPLPEPVMKKQPVVEPQKPLPPVRTQELRQTTILERPVSETVEPTKVREPILEDVPVQTPVPQQVEDTVALKPQIDPIPSIKHILTQTAHSKPAEQEQPSEQMIPVAHRETTQRPTEVTQSHPAPVMEARRTVEVEEVPAHRTVEVEETPTFRTVEAATPQASPAVKEIVEPRPSLTPHPVLTRTEVRKKPNPVTRKAPILEKQPEPQPREQLAAIQRPVQDYPDTQADFGWLAQAIWGEIEKHKQYPRIARKREWEGKVVLEAVIRQDGKILSLHVAETSGYEVLDENAMEVMWKVSPLKLQHPLGRPQITILVPLTYQLDG